MFGRLVGVLVVCVLTLGVSPAHAVEIVAHQGYKNTSVASYRNAARTANILDADLQLTKDNKIIVSHGAWMCGHKIKSMKLYKVQRCNRAVTTLPILIDIAKYNGRRVDIELKSNGGKKWTYTQMKRLYRTLKRKNALSITTVWSTKHSTINKFRRADKSDRVKTGLVVTSRTGIPAVSTIKRYGGKVAIESRRVNASQVASLRSRGVYVALWAIGSSASLKVALAKNPSAVITDVPN